MTQTKPYVLNLALIIVKIQFEIGTPLVTGFVEFYFASKNPINAYSIRNYNWHPNDSNNQHGLQCLLGGRRVINIKAIGKIRARNH